MARESPPWGMRVQDYVVRQTEWAVGNFYRNVRRVPADKLTWKVMDVGRSILDQVQEVAMSPRWSTPLIGSSGESGFDPARFEAMQAEMAKWTTIDDCERVHREHLAELLATIRALPDTALDETVPVAFAPEPVAKSEIIMFHYWNVVYHLGQILFVQTLYGDHTMVF